MPAFNNTKKIHQPNRDLRVPYGWFLMPIATQCVYRLVRSHVDKFARCNIKSHTISYTAWDTKTHTYVPKLLTRTQCHNIFNDLYPADTKHFADGWDALLSPRSTDTDYRTLNG